MKNEKLKINDVSVSAMRVVDSALSIFVCFRNTIDRNVKTYNS